MKATPGTTLFRIAFLLLHLGLLLALVLLAAGERHGQLSVHGGKPAAQATPRR